MANKYQSVNFHRPLITAFIFLSAAYVSIADEISSPSHLFAKQTSSSLASSPQFATYLGGSSIDDCDDIAVDAAGSIYLACHSISKDFPGFKGRKESDDMDAYVSKLDPQTGRLIYTTRLSGNKYDGAFTIEVAKDGSVYVGGITDSDDFPTTSDAIQRKPGGKMDAFLAKIKTDGQLEYSTYLGGAGDDFSTGLVVDNNQRIFLAGNTSSEDFPGPRRSDLRAKGGSGDGFVALWRLKEPGTLRTLLLGGSAPDGIWGIAIDNSDGIYVSGDTQSVDFPVKSASPEKLNGVIDAFLVRLRISDLQIIYSTLLGGSGGDASRGLAIDRTGTPYIAGSTGSEDFPVTPNAFQRKNAGKSDLFIAKFDRAASKLLYSTYLGGTGDDTAGVNGKIFDVDSDGNAWMVGFTDSRDFPIKASSPIVYGGGDLDGFAAALDPSGSKLVFSRFYGGDSRDILEGLAIGVDGSVWATGLTASRNLPITNALQKVNNSANIQLPFDAMIVKIRMPNQSQSKER
jgi:Beta-propeller repeat